ncbi:hypothetical protein ACFFIF_01860 [Vagococcus entomophilus]|uniref:Uncharacterized protein n=1 Tax=Vagococcus entomophilus TaxID=1160095 RepID=A0A430AKB9_9ENTE|nr:hypothetical protein [Vagococcus entomophilus]RSU08453.1 hypothetical protein CBF30_04225 [Vagococcus entomophilus]
MSEEIKGVVKVVNTEEGKLIKIEGNLASTDKMVIASTFIAMLAREYDTSVKGMAYIMSELNRECPVIFKEEAE